MDGNIENDTLVLIPNYNGGSDLLRTVSSIFPEETVDVLVVDDGSDTPPGGKELSDAFRASGRVFVHKLGKNQGIVAALNKGLEIAKEKNYRYVARLDAGDTNCGIRFSKQKSFLDANPKVALVGCWVDFISTSGEHLFYLRHPVDDKAIKKAIFRYNPFVHPAVMFRLDAVLEFNGYPDGYPALEDWACFLMLAKRWQLANLPEVLVKYEVNPNSISSKKRFEQSKSKVKLLSDNYSVSINKTMGLIKSFIILVFPRSILTTLKKFIYQRR